MAVATVIAVGPGDSSICTFNFGPFEIAWTYAAGRITAGAIAAPGYTVPWTDYQAALKLITQWETTLRTALGSMGVVRADADVKATFQRNPSLVKANFDLGAFNHETKYTRATGDVTFTRTAMDLTWVDYLRWRRVLDEFAGVVNETRALPA